MTTTIEVFKPVAACSDSELRDGIVEGLWLAHSLFVALGQIGDQQDNKGALSFLGASIVSAVEEKQKELDDRNAAGGAR